jgi:hypothetical protein
MQSEKNVKVTMDRITRTSLGKKMFYNLFGGSLNVSRVYGQSCTCQCYVMASMYAETHNN